MLNLNTTFEEIEKQLAESKAVLEELEEFDKEEEGEHWTEYAHKY